MHELILRIHPNTDINVGIVWINMLESDNASTARKAAQTIHDKRVRHFHDPNRRVGRVLAKSLGEPKQVAWDMYLFYGAGVEWKRLPPHPVAWAHQLSELWTDHYHYGDDLEKELEQIAERMLRTMKKGPEEEQE